MCPLLFLCVFIVIFAAMKIDEAIVCFRNYISTERRLAARTVQIYTEDLTAFAAFVAQRGISDVEQVSALDIREWQMALMEAGNAPRTVTHYLVSLRSWFKYLRRQKWLTTDIMAKVPTLKVPRRLPVFFRESEVRKIYDCPELFPDTFEGKRDRLLLQVLYETGMRRAELTGLTEGSVDFVNGTIKVLGKRDKERYIPIENELARNIKCYFSLKREIEGCSESFFVRKDGTPMTAAMCYNVVKKYMTSISTADRISPHVFRHSFATHMLNDGADINAIKELLGHTDLMATEVYTHVTREHLKEAYKHAHPRATGKSEN